MFTSGSGATYTTPAGAALITVTACGGGGGGGGAGATLAPTGTTGNTTIFNSVNANGGSGGTGVNGATAASVGLGGAGGTGGTGSATYRVAGSAGRVGILNQTSAGPAGGDPALLGRGAGGTGAASISTSRATGGGGGGGECFVLRIPSPTTSYTYTVGTGGAGGVGTGTGAASGTAGTDGMIVVDEYYGVLSASQSLTLISTQTISAQASIQFTGLATYSNYFMVCRDVFGATAGANIDFQIGTGATPTWQTSGYQYFRVNGVSNSATVLGSASTSASGLSLNVGAAEQRHDFTLQLYDALSTTKPKPMFYYGSVWDTTNVSYKTGEGNYTAANTAVTAIRVFASSGNISGVCSLYGMVQ